MPKTSRFGNLVGDVWVFSGPSGPQGERLPRSDFFLLNLSFLYGLPNRPVFDTRALISRQWPSKCALPLAANAARTMARQRGRAALDHCLACAATCACASEGPADAVLRASSPPAHVEQVRLGNRTARPREGVSSAAALPSDPGPAGVLRAGPGGALTGELIWALALALACRTARPREEPSTRSSRRRW